MFESAPPASEQIFLTNVEAAGNDLPITHDTFRKK